MTKFIEGMKVEKKDFGDNTFLFKVSIKFDDFMGAVDSYVNERGYINIDICKSKTTDKWYARLNEWSPKGNK